LTAGYNFYILGNMDAMRAVTAMGALAQESRLAIFRALVQAGPAGLPAGTIGDRLALPWATLSFHLKELKQAGLAQCRREGRSIIYSADYAATAALVAYLTENCCRESQAPCCAPAPKESARRIAHEKTARSRVRV
jgi:ArsR family transcriptional regulator, arsenate/arsenite/antimonite-responsive transcriptional repressor